MDIEELVSETLRQIVRGVSEAQKDCKEATYQNKHSVIIRKGRMTD